MLADLWDRDRIVQKAHGGRGHEAIREIPVNGKLRDELLNRELFLSLELDADGPGA